MVASTQISDYIASGLLAARPASPNVAAGVSALYYATDNSSAYMWDGAAWQKINPAAAVGVSLVQTGSAAGNAITGVTLASAPVNGNLLVAFICRGVPSANTGWEKFATDGGGSTFTSLFFKVAGAGESATQNPTGGASDYAITIFEFSAGAVPALGAAGVFQDVTATAHTVTPTAFKSTGFFFGIVMSEATGDLPVSFSAGVVGDASAVNGTSRSIQGFHKTVAAVGDLAITANYTPSINARMAGIYVG